VIKSRQMTEWALYVVTLLIKY